MNDYIQPDPLRSYHAKTQVITKREGKLMDEQDKNLTRDDLIGMLQEMAKAYEDLPDFALQQPCTNYDMWSVLRLMVEIIKQ